MSRPGPDAVAEFMRTYVAPGERVIAAVSGGPDSMAMLDLLLRARAACGYELEVAHVHHHLRAASDEEWRFVEEYCQARGVRFHGRHVQVREKAQGRSLEAAAHTLRHAALAEILQKCELKSFESKTAQMLESAVRVLYYKQSIKLSGAVLPQTEIRNLLRKVNRDTLIDAVEVLRHNENEVQNPQGYLYSVILNAVNAEHTSTLLELPDNMIDREMLYASD